jgi:hypothetical protein
MKHLFLLLALMGCMDQEEFEEGFAKEYCGLLEDCEALSTYGYRHRRECEDQASVITKGCNFDADKAESCLTDIAKAGCQDLLDEEFPGSCLGVCS